MMMHFAEHRTKKESIFSLTQTSDSNLRILDIFH